MLTPRNPFQSRILTKFITIYYLSVPILLTLSLTTFYLLFTMCPFLSSCSTRSSWIVTGSDDLALPLSPLYASELGCSSSRCWAEINHKFGEPIGSVRRVQRLGLGAEREILACSLRNVLHNGDDEIADDDTENENVEKEASPAEVLDMSLKKQQKGSEENLYKKVLVDKIMKSVQVEINRKIMESLLIF